MRVRKRIRIVAPVSAHGGHVPATLKHPDQPEFFFRIGLSRRLRLGTPRAPSIPTMSSLSLTGELVAGTGSVARWGVLRAFFGLLVDEASRRGGRTAPKRLRARVIVR